jgi:4-phytase/acid phosphatase
VGQHHPASQITALLPLLTENYDLSNDVFYTAQKRGSILLNAMLEGSKKAPRRTYAGCCWWRMTPISPWCAR